MQGISQIRHLLDTNRDQLHMFLTVLYSLKPSTESASKQHQVLVISLVAQVFKDKLQQSPDSSPAKTCFRLIQVLHRYFTDTSPTVQKACARVFMAMAVHCLTPTQMQSVLVAPLTTILQIGVDRAAQATASVCFSQLVTYCCRSAQEAVPHLAHQLLTILLKINSEYPQLFAAAVTLIDVLHLAFFQNKLPSVVNKILPILHRDALSHYSCKVSVCRLLERVGRLIGEEHKLKLVQYKVEECLEKAGRNRVIQVQMAAQRALKTWRGEEVPAEVPPITVQHSWMQSLQQAREKRKKSRSVEHKSVEKVEEELTFVKQDLQNMVRGGWGASNRAKHFVRRGTGIGGGAKLETSPVSRSNKSHKEHLEELREHIKKGVVVNRDREKFSQVLESRTNGRSQNGARRQYQKQGKREENKYFAMEEEVGVEAVRPSRKKEKKEEEIGMNILSHVKYQQNEEHAEKCSHFMEGMSQNQIKQLLNHQQSLMQQAQISLLTDSKVGTSYQSHEIVNKQTNNQYKKSNFNNLTNTNNVNNHKIPTPKPVPIVNVQKASKMAVALLSQQQISELMQQCDLSQMSDNLDGILNESDLLGRSKLQMIDSGILQQDVSKPPINLRQVIDSSRSNHRSRLTVNKFMKQPLQVPLTHSLNFTQSNPSREVRQKQIIVHAPHSPQVVHKATETHTTNTQTQKRIKEQSKQKREPQFTLNPRDKYSSVKEAVGDEQEIQEDIVLSEYEESVPKKNIPQQLQLPKVIPKEQNIIKPSIGVVFPKFMDQISQGVLKQQNMSRGIQPKQKKISNVLSNQQQESKIYQVLIRNPPHKGVSISPSNPQLSNSQLSGWQQISLCLQQGSINQAFELAFANEDPIDLLRLMVVSECPIRQLTATNAAALWDKFLAIYHHKLIDVLFVRLFKQGEQLKILKKCLAVQEIRDVMVSLYEVSGGSKGKLSYHAATLYNAIDCGLKQ